MLKIPQKYDIDSEDMSNRLKGNHTRENFKRTVFTQRLDP